MSAVPEPPFFAEHDVTLYRGSAETVLPTLPAESVHCVVTSPPYYGLRDYGVEGQLGLEPSPGEYVAALRQVFAEVRRVLRPDGTLWLNLGDSYVGSANSGGENGKRPAGSGHGRESGSAAGAAVRVTGLPPKLGLPAKNLLGIPWRVAFALQDDGWILRNAIVWHKTNAMPESVTDRLSSRHEYVFMLARSRRYSFDLKPIREAPAASTVDRYRYAFEANSNAASSTNHLRDGGMMMPARLTHTDPTPYPPGTHPQTNRGPGKPHDQVDPDGRNPGDVWAIPTQPYPGAHFAVMPPELARRCIKAGCPPGGVVLDPFAGAGTTLMVAREQLRDSIGIELSPASCDLIVDRIGQPVFDFDATS